MQWYTHTHTLSSSNRTCLHTSTCSRTPRCEDELNASHTAMPRHSRKQARLGRHVYGKLEKAASQDALDEERLL